MSNQARDFGGDRGGERSAAEAKGNIRSVKKNPPLSPNLQAFVERVIQTLKHEILNAFCIVSDAHLDHLLKVGQDWYNHRRGDSGRDHLPPIRDDEPPIAVDFATDAIVCHRELGGHLKSYQRAA